MVDLEDSLLMVETRSEMEAFLIAVLSPSELKKFRKRWEIFQHELAGQTQRSVSSELGAGIGTASRVAAAIREHGAIIKTILSRAGQWQPPRGSAERASDAADEA
jgi:uncharacterized protein YerC